MTRLGRLLGPFLIACGVAGSFSAAAAEPADSAQLLKAKDLMSDERWAAAIPVLQAAVANPKEQNKDEALFWLSHSQNQAGDLAEAVESIQRLQREYPKSRWSAPAYSLLIELAQKLGRHDVLWWTANRPVPPPPPARPRVAVPSRPPGVRHPAPLPPAAPDTAPPAAAPPSPASPVPATPPIAWLPESYRPDMDLRVQALGRLIQTDAQKVIPMLRSIALETDNPAAARRAVFVLAQSRNPEAQMMVVDVAKRGAEMVRIAAVRELGRFGGPNVSTELLQVYSTADTPVKQQVVVSLGERADRGALLKIAQSETDPRLRGTAIMTLGRAGAREQLRVMYADASTETRLAVIRGLFNARDEEGLLSIADQEKQPRLRREVLERLRLIGTPRARAYIEKNRE